MNLQDNVTAAPEPQTAPPPEAHPPPETHPEPQTAPPPETHPEPQTMPPPEETSGPDSSNALFPGDKGELPLDTRRTLVQLLSGPLLDGKRHSRLWSVLLRDEVKIRRYLSELFLELIIEYDLQVAFTKQAQSEDVDIPRLLRRVQLNFLQTVLFLYLRQQFVQASAAGERVVVSGDDIVEQLRMYDKEANTDKSGFDKRISTAIERMKEYHILQEIKGSDNRFEISPILNIIFTAEDIAGMIKLYKAVNDGCAVQPPAQPAVQPAAQPPVQPPAQPPAQPPVQPAAQPPAQPPATGE